MAKHGLPIILWQFGCSAVIHLANILKAHNCIREEVGGLIGRDPMERVARERLHAPAASATIGSLRSTASMSISGFARG
jgi:hypothetical protein